MAQPLIIVPYRDRKAQLAQFIPHMRERYPEMSIIIVQQADDKPFNRGKLLNIGFLEMVPEHCVMHDVDMLPLTIDYSPAAGITQLAASKIQLQDYMGGITMFSRRTFLELNGYTNNFFHRAEDNELMFRAKESGRPIVNRFGSFRSLAHARPILEFDPILWKKAQQPRSEFDGLTYCSYTKVAQEQCDGYMLLTVLL